MTARHKPVALQPGKRYVQRNGRVTGPLRHYNQDAGTNIEYCDPISYRSWSVNGRFSGEYNHEFDLVREYRPKRKPAPKREMVVRWAFTFLRGRDITFRSHLTRDKARDSQILCRREGLMVSPVVRIELPAPVGPKGKK